LVKLNEQAMNISILSESKYSKKEVEQLLPFDLNAFKEELKKEEQDAFEREHGHSHGDFHNNANKKNSMNEGIVILDNDFEDKLNQSDELELNSVRNVKKQDKYQFNENHIKDLKKEFYNVGKETEVNMNEFKSL
jgi:hypothetical protein